MEETTYLEFIKAFNEISTMMLILALVNTVLIVLVVCTLIWC